MQGAIDGDTPIVHELWDCIHELRQQLAAQHQQHSALLSDHAALQAQSAAQQATITQLQHNFQLLDSQLQSAQATITLHADNLAEAQHQAALFEQELGWEHERLVYQESIVAAVSADRTTARLERDNARLQLAAADHTIADLRSNLQRYQWAQRGVHARGIHICFPALEFRRARAQAAASLHTLPIEEHNQTAITDDAFRPLPEDRDTSYFLEQLFVAATISPAALLDAIAAAQPVLVGYLQRNRAIWVNAHRADFQLGNDPADCYEVFNAFLAGYNLERITERLPDVDVTHCGFLLRVMRK